MAPGQRGGLLRGAQSRLARFDPGAPVGDRRQFAASYAVEQTPARSCGEIGKVIPEEPGQFRMGGHDAAVSLGPMLELSYLAHAAIVGPLAARVGRDAADVELVPVVIVVVIMRRQDHIVPAEVDRFLGGSPAYYITAKKATSRGPLGRWARTASSSARAWRGFTTLRRST